MRANVELDLCVCLCPVKRICCSSLLVKERQSSNEENTACDFQSVGARSLLSTWDARDTRLWGYNSMFQTKHVAILLGPLSYSPYYNAPNTLDLDLDYLIS